MPSSGYENTQQISLVTNKSSDENQAILKVAHFKKQTVSLGYKSSNITTKELIPFQRSGGK